MTMTLITAGQNGTLRRKFIAQNYRYLPLVPNRLANETSPYLLQHAHNPVDWYPWGKEAIQRARHDDKPILLSIGYSACHWCHVMERESFENEETAALMNQYFVCIKVDREERPDLDSIYMQAVQALTGHGGWPMTMFLTPDLEPFWGGTYFPPTDRPGMPSFRRVLTAVGEAYLNQGEDVEKAAAAMREMYRTALGARSSERGVTAETLRRATQGILAQYDKELGGFGGAPKFPQTMAMGFLLQQWARTGDRDALDAAHKTFLRMARGGIYDQVGGGFARYSVDDHWLVPHFEKMLYDNALLLRFGVQLWQATKDPVVERIVREVLEWLKREMTSPAGGFYSTLDADSEGEEGKFYLWDVAELRELLSDDAEAVIEFWGASEGGNFEGRNILCVNHEREPDARISRARQVLYAARAKRVWPARDEKILASWNGLMLRAVADAARAFDSREWRAQATANGDFLFREMVRDGRVFRTHKDGVSKIAGFLEDHAAVALGAIALYELTFDRAWLDRAKQLADAIGKWFWDDTAGAFYDTATDHEELVTRPMDLTDNATPAGASLAVELFLRLGDLLGDADFVRRANTALRRIAEPMARHPLAFGYALTAADIVVNGAVEVAIAGEPGSADFRALTRVVAERYAPSVVLAGGATANQSGVALMDSRTTRDGRATAYVCKNYACDEPVTDADALARQLDKLSRPALP
jgi:uncharacterized protein YyaL (SSP411 family)